MSSKNRKRKYWNDFFNPDEGSDEDDFIQSDNDYSFDRYLFNDEERQKMASKGMESAAKKGDIGGFLRSASKLEKTTNAKSYDPYQEYKATGVWRGYSYYTPPRLDARYIEQIANALAARYKIDVVQGETWCVDIERQQLTYDPSTLIYGTKGRMLAALLHEIGHIRHTTPSTKLDSEYLKKYPSGAHHVVNLFEDIRIDKIMAKSYPSAEDIFEQNKPIVREIAEGYAKKAKYIKDGAIQDVKDYFKRLAIGIDVRLPGIFDKQLRVSFTDQIDNHVDNFSSADKIKLREARKQIFGTDKLDQKFLEGAEKLVQSIVNMDTLEDYSAGVLLIGYGEELTEDVQGRVRERIEQTKGAIPRTTKSKETQELTTILDKDVYPVIEDLLKEDQQREQQMEALAKAVMNGSHGAQAASKFGKWMAERMGQRRSDKSKGQAAQPQPQSNGQMQRRDEGGSNRGKGVDPEWRNGQYKPLKDSVQVEIDRLTRQLKLIKKRESVINYTDNQRRGRIATHHLKRFPAGNYRMFKKKQENTDTVSSYAFTVMLDISGSMYEYQGAPIVHAVRGSVIFAEVFKNLNIPYEFITFDNDGKTIVPFGTPMSKNEQSRIAGITARGDGGGTNLDAAFRKTEILKQTQKNKIIVILSDGGVGSFDYYDAYKKKFEEGGAKLIGISIGAGPDIVDFCGEGKEVDDVSKLPTAFSDIIKNIFKKK